MESWAARAGIAAGLAGAAANALLIAYLVLLLVRPGDAQSTLGPLAAILGGLSAALLIPLAFTLGSAGISVLGVVAMVVLAGSWWLVAAGVVGLQAAAPAVTVAALGLAVWLVLMCGEPTVPPRASRFGRRAGVAAGGGTLVVALALALLPASIPQLVVLVAGAVPGALGWLAVPAWSLRVGRWLRATRVIDPADTS